MSSSKLRVHGFFFFLTNPPQQIFCLNRLGILRLMPRQRNGYGAHHQMLYKIWLVVRNFLYMAQLLTKQTLHRSVFVSESFNALCITDIRKVVLHNAHSLPFF